MIKNYYDTLTPLLKIRIHNENLFQANRPIIDIKNSDKTNKKHYVNAIQIGHNGIYLYNIHNTNICYDMELTKCYDGLFNYGKLKIIGIDVV